LVPFASGVKMVYSCDEKGSGEGDSRSRAELAGDDQEKVARFVREVEERRAGDDISDEEWEIIEARAARRDLASEREVQQVFDRFRSA
jgi:hypothetical protein